jgi:F0F1-type ATP synthase membrane subunit b/b'
MSFSKAQDLIRLAQMAAARHGGISLEEICAAFGVSHRTAQRMTDALKASFGNVEVTDGEDRRRRWRLVDPGLSRLQLRHETALEALEQRKQRIAESLANAEKIKAELAKAKKSGATIISDAEKEAKLKASKIIDDAKLKAKSEASKIISDAHATVDAYDKKLQAEATKVASRLLKEALKKLPAKDAEKITSSIIAEL